MHPDHSARAADLYRAEMEGRATRSRLLALARHRDGGAGPAADTGRRLPSVAGGGEDRADASSDDGEHHADEHQGQAREQAAQ